jgi:hypothetical protein
MNVERFEDFFGHEEEAIKNAAVLLAEARKAFDGGEITQSEFTELSTDILEIEEIDGLADNIDRQAAYQQAYEGLRILTSAITLI